jgi:hypothetical protein
MTFCRFFCKNGQKFVSKPDFQAGLSTNVVANLFATCQISGWFNESIGFYTCTVDCGPPTDYSWLMTNNYTTSPTPIKYDKTFKYVHNLLLSYYTVIILFIFKVKFPKKQNFGNVSVNVENFE